MELRILFGIRHQQYEGQHAPEILTGSTEFEDDDNPAYLRYQLEDAQRSDEFETVKLVTLVVDQAQLVKLMTEQPKLTAKIKPTNDANTTETTS